MISSKYGEFGGVQNSSRIRCIPRIRKPLVEKMDHSRGHYITNPNKGTMKGKSLKTPIPGDSSRDLFIPYMEVTNNLSKRGHVNSPS